MIAYRYNHETKEYEGTTERQIDPLETKLKGEPVYLMPGDATLIEPPEAKEGFKIVWNGEAWEYKEEPKPEEPEPYEMTELDKAYEELYLTKRKLDEMDYIGTKIATGRATKEEYADQIALMSELAIKVDECNARIKELESEQE